MLYNSNQEQFKRGDENMINLDKKQLKNCIGQEIAIIFSDDIELNKMWVTLKSVESSKIMVEDDYENTYEVYFKDVTRFEY
jgi:ribosome maturation factor RimP